MKQRKIKLSPNEVSRFNEQIKELQKDDHRPVAIHFLAQRPLEVAWMAAHEIEALEKENLELFNRNVELRKRNLYLQNLVDLLNKRVED